MSRTVNSFEDAVVLLNIGNTHTQIARAENGLIGESRRVSTEMLRASDFDGDCPVAVASVVPAALARLKKLNPFLVHAGVVAAFDWSSVDPSTLGADRIANAMVLAEDYALPAVCVDFGTAVTLEAVGPGAVFLGGSISPGRALMRKALHDYTAQLPLLPLSETLPAIPGVNTVAAMIQGIDLGAVGMVRELLEAFKVRLGEKLTVVAAGGDRGFFLRHLPFMVDGGDDFTLRGIYKIWKANHAR